MSLLLNLSPDELRSRFFELKTREDVAALLDISDYQLRYHLYILPDEQRYKTFNISKKTGGTRVISAPSSALKIIQQKLNQVLYSIYQAKAPTHGFVVGKNVATNAAMHLRQRYVFNIDLEDFFPSINFGRVRGLFLSSPYNCTSSVATVLAQICCHSNSLPQGAPTSPIISNLICLKMDSQLRLLAKKYRCIYTRYADDITFSTSISRFPQPLVFVSDHSGQLIIGDELLQVIGSNGFNINVNKVRLQTRNHRQEVTGVIVNKKLNVHRKYVRQIRAMLYAWRKHGLENAQAEFWEKHDDKQRKITSKKPSFKRVVRGKIEYLGMIRGKNDLIYIKFCTELQSLDPEYVSIMPLHKLEIPVLPCPEIWTEGKTDWKHLKAALQGLQSLGIFSNLTVNFKEDFDEGKQGNAELLSTCKHLCKVNHHKPIIAIFDRDDTKILEQVHDEILGYKEWGNGVYSLALPVPNHRSLTPDICIELYYKDSEIQCVDSLGRRLFLSTEFTPSGRHKIERHVFTHERNKVMKSKLTIIDTSVFNDSDVNIALSKDDFAENIRNKILGFHDFDFSEFRAVFDIVVTILKAHIAINE
jgi:RNA-directed DNA polymerase